MCIMIIRRCAIASLAFVLWVVAAPPALHASAPAPHEPGQSYMYLRIHEDSLAVRLEIRAEDLNQALGLGWRAESGRSETEIATDLRRIREYVEARFSLAAEGRPLDLRFTGLDVRFVDWGDFVMLNYESDGLEAVPDSIDIDFSLFFEWNPDHRDMVIIEHNWKTGTFNNEAGVSLIMSPGNTSQTLDLTTSSVWRGFIAMIWQGVWHILIGLDHILFLVALVLPAVLVRADGRWEPAESFRTALIKLVAIVTFFTIAHSVTLSLAALDLVRFPSRVIESIIAASIAVAAAANLMPQLHIREWLIAFLFGLFHGFGFASVLGDIGLSREFLVLTLLGFNIGVELGQIAIIAVIFPILFVLRGTRLYRWIFRLGSAFLILIALHWVAERWFGWSIPIRRIIGGFFA